MSPLTAIGDFTINQTITVPENYRWDDGLPLSIVPYYDMRVNLPPVAVATSTGIQHIGLSPFMSVTLSSTYTPHPSSVGVKRTYDFGDYYNTESNIQISTCFNDESICHVYVMPGVYTIKVTFEEYRLMPKVIVPPGQYDQDAILSNYPKDAFWQWRNFLCVDHINPLNRKITWNYSSDCFCCYAWRDAKPCLCQPICVWDAACPIETLEVAACIDPGPQCPPLTWESVECVEPPLTPTPTPVPTFGPTPTPIPTPTPTPTPVPITPTPFNPCLVTFNVEDPIVTFADDPICVFE